MVINVFRGLVFGLVSASLAGCLWNTKVVPVGDTKVSYNELCSKERPKCVPDGEFYKIMKLPRPAVKRNTSGASYTEKWEDYLGRVVRKGNETITEPCVALGVTDFTEDFERFVDVDVIKESDLSAKITAAIDASLVDVDVKDKPKLTASLESNIVTKLKENAYTKFHYKVINVNYPILDGITSASSTDGDKYTCKKQIETGGVFFIRSLAAIGSEAKLKSNHASEIRSIIAADLSNVTTTSGSPINASLVANLSIDITKKTEMALTAITDGHTGVYALGYWGPHFADIKFSNEEFLKSFSLSPSIEKRLVK